MEKYYEERCAVSPDHAKDRRNIETSGRVKKKGRQQKEGKQNSYTPEKKKLVTKKEKRVFPSGTPEKKVKKVMSGKGFKKAVGKKLGENFRTRKDRTP